jgi:hypothetical protein
MGVEASSAGVDTQSWADAIWKTYKHPDKNTKMSVTIEEAYIVKKQMSLNLHFVSASKI